MYENMKQYFKIQQISFKIILNFNIFLIKNLMTLIYKIIIFDF